MMNPHNAEAEASYLGAVLIDNAVLTDYPLTDADFYKPSWRLVHEAMRSMQNEGLDIDLVTLSQKMQEAGTLDDAGGVSAISYINGLTPSAKMAGRYAEIIRAEKQKRDALQIAKIMKSAIESGDDVAAALDAAQRGLTDLIHVNTRREMTKAEKLAEFFAWVENRAKRGDLPGITTGNRDLDKLLLGWQDGDLVILAARPGMGKTALALNFLHDAAAAGYAGRFYSLEMPNEQIFARLAAMEKGLTTGRIMNPASMIDDDWGALVNAGVVMHDLPYDVDDSKRSYSELARKIRRDVSMGARFAIIDYLQLIRGDRRENRTQEISAISNGLKGLAVELRIPIIALSQLSRAVEGRNDKRPMLSDLRESGSIEQDADVVLFLYRDDYYNENTNKPWAELEIAKQRKGRGQGRVKMYWDPEKMRFKEFSPLNEADFGVIVDEIPE